MGFPGLGKDWDKDGQWRRQQDGARRLDVHEPRKNSVPTHYLIVASMSPTRYTACSMRRSSCWSQSAAALALGAAAAILRAGAGAGRCPGESDHSALRQQFEACQPLRLLTAARINGV